MADYHPLITRAVSVLDKDTAENRRVLYERARTALVSQLRGTVPPLDESEITRERLALEEAIRRVEVESARRAREAPKDELVKGAYNGVHKELPKEPLRGAPKETSFADPLVLRRASDVVLRVDGVRRESAPVQTQPIHRAESELREQAVPPAPPLPIEPKPAETGIKPAGAVSQEYREQADGLAIARETTRHEASKETQSADTPHVETAARSYQHISDRHDARGEEGDGAHVPEAELPPITAPPTIPQYSTASSLEATSLQPASAQPTQQPPLEVLRGLESLQSGVSPLSEQAPPVEQVRPLGGYAHSDVGYSPRYPEPVMQVDEPVRTPRSLRSYGRLIWIGIALLVVLGAGGAAYWQRDAIIGAARNLVASGPTTPVQRDTAPARQKIADRIGQPDSAQPSKGGSATAQRAMLTTEPDPNNPAGRNAPGKDYVGTANWRIENIPAGPGRAAEVAIKLEVEIPDRGFAMTWLIKRNTDATLPATHTIDIEFNIAPNSSLGTISEIRHLVMKQPDQSEGLPLWGHAQKSTPNYFLVGLSATPADAQYNLRLLKEQGAFDFALVFTKARRAFLLIEKGPVGERVFAEAFAAWKQ